MTINRCIAVLAASLLGIGLTACQDESAETDPSRSSPPTEIDGSRPTPSGELPELPGAASRETREGALAFGRYYYDLINYGRATGDWQPAKDVTAPSCKPCQDFWAKNPRRMDNDLSIRFATAPFVARFDESKKIVVFDVSSDRDVKNVTREPFNEWADQLHLRYEESRWSVVDLEIKDLG